MINIALVTPVTPAFRDNGSSVHLWTLINTIKDQGNRAQVFRYGISLEKAIDDITALENISVPVKTFSPSIKPKGSIESWVSNLHALINPRLSESYPAVLLYPKLKQEVLHFKPDFVAFYTAEAAAVSGILEEAQFRTCAMVVDMDHLVVNFRRSSKEKTHSLKEKCLQFMGTLIQRRKKAHFLSILKKCGSVVCHAKHHALWLQSQGITKISYRPIAVLDRYQDDGIITKTPKNVPDQREIKEISKILMIGNIQGIATLTGLHLVRDMLLPGLRNLYLRNKFEIHIIGGGSVEGLDKLSQESFIVFRGYIADVSTEFEDASIVLVPTPIDLGFRTRIAEAFSFSKCVIAHSANAYGMPELVHRQNAMLCKDADSFISAISECLHNSDLRASLEKNARKTYINSYEGKKVSSEIINDFLDTITNSVR